MKRAHNFKDLTGQKFGRLLVIGIAGKNKDRRLLWNCICDCGNEYTVSGKQLRRKKTKSCGCLRKEIISNLNKGKKFTEQHLEHLSKAHKGAYPTKETRKKMSKSQQSIRHKNNYWLGKTGKDHGRYNPNITDKDRIEKRDSSIGKKWTQEVYKLDDYTCRKCEQSGKYLNAHHIESYNSNPELRTEVSNGITLCEDCHTKFHHQYGYGDNTRAQLIEFLKQWKL